MSSSVFALKPSSSLSDADVITDLSLPLVEDSDWNPVHHRHAVEQPGIIICFKKEKRWDCKHLNETFWKILSAFYTSLYFPRMLFSFFFTDIESYRPRSYEDFQGPNLNLQIIFVCIIF